MLIDTHCHLNFSAFHSDFEEVVQRTLSAGIKVINVGSQYSTSQRAVKIAREYQGRMYAAVGLHPVHLFDMEVDEEETKFNSRQEAFNWEKYYSLAKSQEVVAIGEMGIDYFHIPKNVSRQEFENLQRWTFLRGVNLAKELELPVIIHCRGAQGSEKKAYNDVLDILDQTGYFKAVIHCFTSDWETASKFLDRGCLISFTGIITYPKTEKLALVVRKVPIDRIMVETDAPYLAPQIVRGKRNEPQYVRYVASRIAEIKGLEYDEVEKKTADNAANFFNLK